MNLAACHTYNGTSPTLVKLNRSRELMHRVQCTSANIHLYPAAMLSIVFENVFG